MIRFEETWIEALRLVLSANFVEALLRRLCGAVLLLKNKEYYVLPWHTADRIFVTVLKPQG